MIWSAGDGEAHLDTILLVTDDGLEDQTADLVAVWDIVETINPDYFCTLTRASVEWRELEYAAEIEPPILMSAKPGENRVTIRLIGTTKC